MAKILKVTVNYPENSKDMEKLQDKAMSILAKSIIRELPSQVVNEVVKKLQSKI